jgi:hypothetical protein
MPESGTGMLATLASAEAHILGRGEPGAARNLAASFSAVGAACAKNFFSPGHR